MLGIQFSLALSSLFCFWQTTLSLPTKGHQNLVLPGISREHSLRFAPQPWQGSSATFTLTISGYKFPETMTYHFSRFIVEMGRALLEKEVAVGGDKEWKWPDGQYKFQSIDNIIIELKQEPDALRPLTLGQTMEIVPLLREWGRSKPDIGLVPGAGSLQIAMKRASQVVLTKGSITMPEDWLKSFSTTNLESRDLKHDTNVTTPAISIPLDPSDYTYGDHLVRLSRYSEPYSEGAAFTALISDLDHQINVNLRRTGLYSAPWPEPHAICVTGPLKFKLSPAPLEDELSIAVVDTVSSALHAWSFGFAERDRPSARIEVYIAGQQAMGPVAVGGVERVFTVDAAPSAERVAVM